MELGYEYLVTNMEPVPITVQLKFELNNLRANTNPDQLFVVPAFATDHKILELRPVRQDSYGYNVSARYTLGNQKRDDYDLDFVYHLPFARATSYRVSQGNNGRSTHRGKNAIDFSMPVGTAIYAARGGTVVQIKDDSSLGCNKPKCLEYGNYIRILHDDGTIAEYTHLKVNGSTVQKGERVQADQHIGYSGNTGWTTGPHLHFTVYIPRLGKKPVSIPVKFLVDQNIVSNDLQENRFYRKP
jgi:murein DD-endopeptidase MepM/ murein hydrolase activator NlpD